MSHSFDDTARVGGVELPQRIEQRERPRGRLAMRHTWADLLFLHWRMPPEAIQQILPETLTVDTYDGFAWLGVVPFFMRNVRPWWLPALPGGSRFQEINLRTYAFDRDGVPGVWFLSLDAGSRLAVWGARTFYDLPYHFAQMSHSRDQQGRIEYVSRRASSPRRLTSRLTYGPAGGIRAAEPGSLEFFLVERYVLFAHGRRGLRRGWVKHPPYPVQDADVSLWDDHLLRIEGWASPGRAPDHAAFSRGVDVEVMGLI